MNIVMCGSPRTLAHEHGRLIDAREQKDVA